ncbi:DUF11 domain-containing protein [Bailinhaonella thermotolerans]|uniref:DUF11 domain-containing protein n=1 Tax=Bailinhaonella thermotolerans TaxID=1070861 RepID=A0A3A4AZ42_9ACTN|nr:DUF11 domain-containing protein [Bailinhaonella thermotolerans]RJL35952.1 DUF11 domain-containing protein [Bailinhaonella thermotolerans]
MAEAQNPAPGGCGKPVRLENGGFDKPEIPQSERKHPKFFNKGQVPGWKTTERGGEGQIEIWRAGDNYEGVESSKAGDPQFAELNANEPSMLYQDLDTPVDGQKLYWSLSHRGRRGEDTMYVRIGPVPAEGQKFQPNNEPVNGKPGKDTPLVNGKSWGRHSGVYIVPAGQRRTRFGFEAGPTASNDKSVGNFLDDISFGTEPCVVLTKKVVPASGEVKAGDTLTYEVTATNEGGSPADNLILTDTIPAGTSYVPGSLRITHGPGTGETLPDNRGQGRAYYDPASRTVTFHLGEGATATKGGRLTETSETTPVSTTAQFRVTVDRSGGGPIENQAVATYDNTMESPVESKRSVSNAVSTARQRATKLSLTKAADRTQVTVGEIVTFHILVTNQGPGEATGVSVTDRLPRNLTYVSATATGGSGGSGYDPATGVWHVGTLAPRTSAHLELKAAVTRPGSIRNIARARANETTAESGTGTSTITLCAYPPASCPPGGGGGHGGWGGQGGHGGCGGQGGWGGQGGCSPVPAPCPEACGLTASGRTEPGKGWRWYSDKTVFIDVDTTDAGFTATPVYLTSLDAGQSWVPNGFTQVSGAAPTGFRLYFWRADGAPFSPADAERLNLQVNWIGHQQPE